MQIITKQQAIAAGLTTYFTGKPCKYGHVAERFLSGNCRECKKIHLNAAYANNEAHRARRKQVAKEWYEQNKDAAKQSMAEWRAKNRARKIASDRERHRANKDQINAKRRAAWGDEDRRKAREAQAKRLASNPVFSMAARMRSYLSSSLRYNSWAKHKRTEEVLGCTFVDFKAHIEKQFLSGMSWENRRAWHVDHIVPVSSAKTADELMALFHFTNLRPMWARDNIAKGNEMTHLI
jgi:hypothetical protein